MPKQDSPADNFSQNGIPDPAELTATVTKIAEKSQQIVSRFLEHQGQALHTDPFNMGSAFLEMTAHMMSNPEKVFQAQASLWQGYMELWHNTARAMSGEEVAPVVEPESGDRRFRHEDWGENSVFDFIKQSYLLTSRWFQTTVGDVEGMDEKTAQKVDFYTRHFMDAISPSNFVLSNPEVLRATIESKGENLVQGLDNMITDLDRGEPGRLDITMTDHDAFTIGENIAVTPGKVVFQNDLLQLIQYAPTTKKVKRRPLLILTPWINKFYILDLSPKNSFIKWALDQGHTVFIVSWVNPDEKLSHKSFEDYMLEGPLTALDAIEKATGEREVNVIGYCIGGTLLAATMAYMAEKKDDRIKSATFFTTLMDFSDPGELGVFIDEEQLTALEEKMKSQGYLEGREMATTFSMLRANDLIWSFVVNNYLLGKDPFPFDLLHWNADSTRMPAEIHSFYLRNMYLENNLVKPGAITLDGVAIDLGKIKTPAFILSTHDDHIAPWKTTYTATRLLSGPVKFVLASSGHIAGVINPPQSGKYCYWTHSRNATDPDKWLETANQSEGSWWPEWEKWISKHAGGQVPARVPGDGEIEAIEDAPGSYVVAEPD
jgi:polyhydroxyalkanoate synthase